MKLQLEIIKYNGIFGYKYKIETKHNKNEEYYVLKFDGDSIQDVVEWATKQEMIYLYYQTCEGLRNYDRYAVTSEQLYDVLLEYIDKENAELNNLKEIIELQENRRTKFK